MKINHIFMTIECTRCKNKFLLVKDNSLIKNVFCPYCGVNGYLEFDVVDYKEIYYLRVK